MNLYAIVNVLFFSFLLGAYWLYWQLPNFYCFALSSRGRFCFFVFKMSERSVTPFTFDVFLLETGQRICYYFTLDTTSSLFFCSTTQAVIAQLLMKAAMKNTQFFAQNPLCAGLFLGPDGP